MSEIITSPSNNKIKLVKSLQNRSRSRKAEAAFVIEGVRLVEEAQAAHYPIDFLLYDETLSARGKMLIDKLRNEERINIDEITPKLLAEISDTETPQGILAVIKMRALSLPEAPSFVVIADQIRDPGNMGTLLRTSEAAGADAVLATPGTVDAFSPKVIRAGMGAHFHLPIEETSWANIQSYTQGMAIFLASSEEGIPLWETDMRQPCALLIGGEAFGASHLGENIATHRVTIPMQGRAESLNAAIAAGILIAEVLRQRYKPTKD